MRRLVAAGFGLLVLASTPATAAVSEAGNHTVTAASIDASSLEAQFAWQASISAYKEHLMAAAALMPNYSGAALDTINHELTIMGASAPSPGVEAAIAAAPANVTVTYQVVPFSLAQLDEVRAQLWSRAAIWSITYAADYSGITVTYRPSAQDSLPSTVATVPVEWIPRSDGVAVPAQGRASGDAPFDGGSRIVRPNGAGCSTATKVQRASGDKVILTAHHCNFAPGDELSGGSVGIEWRLAGDNSLIGQSGGLKSQQWDVQSIDGKTYSGLVWMGGAIQYNTLEPVTLGAGEPANNELFYLSGGYSGSTAALVADVHSSFRFCLDNDNHFCEPHDNFVKMRDADASGDAIGGEGDSGGPMVQYTDSGNLKFGGVISAGDRDFNATCVGIGGRACWSRMWVSPWSRFKDALTVSIP